MKNLFAFLVSVLLSASVFLPQQAGAQSPEKMSYQAVVRNSSDALVTNTPVGMQISILQGSASGTVVYIETQTPTTNANGLASIEIGTGTTSGDFTTIDWANGPYYIKTETDLAGGISYTISGTSQLLSVPYALHAKTAETVLGGITETDPVFGASVAFGIIGTDTANWNNKQDQLIAGNNINIVGNTISGTSGGGGFTHYIGEHFGGGIVFHLWKDAQGIEHGLIVATTNQSTGTAWSNVGNTLIGATAQSSWDGLSNSNAIVGQSGHTSSAASLCLNLVTGGQSDWYLPAIDELSLLWHNRFNVNMALSTIGGATVLPSDDLFWSSTEYTSYIAEFFIFASGFANYGYGTNKAASYYVRAVRTF